MNDTKICKCGIAAVDCDYHKPSKKVRAVARAPWNGLIVHTSMDSIAGYVFHNIGHLGISAVAVEAGKPGEISIEVEWGGESVPYSCSELEVIDHFIKGGLPFALHCEGISHSVKLS